MTDLKPNETKTENGEKWEKKGTEVCVTIQYYYGSEYWHNLYNVSVQIAGKEVWREEKRQGSYEIAEQRANEWIKNNCTVNGKKIERMFSDNLNYRLSKYQAKKKAELKNF